MVSAITANAADDVLNSESTDSGEATSGTTAMIRQNSPVLGYEALSVAGQHIDAAYIEESLGERRGAIVFFHDQGEAFESNGVVTPLRHHLPEYGWSTLTLSFDFPFTPNIMLSASLATPVGDEAVNDADQSTINGDNTKRATLPAVSNPERVDAALAMLQAKGFKRVIFLGHGKGAKVALDVLKLHTLPVEGLILVGLDDVDIDDDFKGIEIPILDMYGEQDLVGVESAVNKRKAAMKRVGKMNYSVRRVLAANHMYYGLEPILLMTVRSWLKSNIVEMGKE